MQHKEVQLYILYFCEFPPIFSQSNLLQKKTLISITQRNFHESARQTMPLNQYWVQLLKLRSVLMVYKRNNLNCVKYVSNSMLSRLSTEKHLKS